MIAPKFGFNSSVDYSLVPADKSQKSASSQVIKSNTNVLADDNSDSLNVDDKKYKLKKNNKIKFVNY